MDFTTLAWIDAQGYHFADFPTFLAAVTAAYQGIYGSDIYLGADSMDGQWVNIIAQSFYDMAALGASVYNSFSPVTAQGVGLARNVKINGLTKGVPTNSSVILTIVGAAGTIIGDGTPANAGIAIDSLQQQWILPLSVTIPGGGSIDVTATAQVPGAIAAAINTITGIFTPTLGWQTVNNAAAATPGNPVETDGALRVRQQNSTNLPATTLLSATAAALSNLPGVLGVAPYENDSDTTDANGLTPHSVCFVVNGGALDQITNVIGLYKTQGTNTFASGPNERNEHYTDPGGLPVAINFISPAIPATINVELNVTPLTANWSSDFIPLIQQAIADFISQIKIGGTVIFTELYLPAYLAGTNAQGSFSVSGLEIEKNTDGFAAADIVLDFDEVTFCEAANVSVTVL